MQYFAPQLVEKIMELKQSTNGNIVACFKNGYLHIFINDKKDSFEPNINNVNLMGDIQKFMQDFTLVSGTIDVLDINNSVYAQGNAQPPMQAPYQNYSNSTSPRQFILASLQNLRAEETDSIIILDSKGKN